MKFPDDILCLERLWNEVYDNKEAYCGNLCPKECDSNDYLTGVSTYEFPTDTYVDQLLNDSFITTKYPNITHSELKSSLMSFDVYYPDLKYTEISQDPKYGLVDFLSSVGGSLGLLIGASFLSFLEIFEVLIRSVLILFKSTDSDKVSQF